MSALPIGLGSLVLRSGVVALVAALLAVPAAAAPSTGHEWHKRALDATPRAQWNANFGYCGETSLITAGLQFGQYTSEWTARAIASPGVPQTAESSQLLLGANDLRAARSMRLTAERSPRSRDIGAFTSWVRNRFLRGDVVIVGVFNNTRMLREQGPGDPTYDHIVPVYGYESARPLKAGRPSRADDVLTISDNGLRTLGPNMPMLYSYRVGDLPRTRKGANAAGGPVYSLPASGPWHGLAVTGVRDEDGVTLPVRVDVSVNSEGQQNQPALTAAPASSPIVLTVEVSRPADGSESLLYQYDGFEAVPVRDFNANAVSAARVWRIPAGEGSFTVRVDAMSSDTRVFRAVPVSAP